MQREPPRSSKADPGRWIVDREELEKVWPEARGRREVKCTDWKTHLPHAMQVMKPAEPIRWDPNADITPLMDQLQMPTVEIVWCWGRRGTR